MCSVGTARILIQTVCMTGKLWCLPVTSFSIHTLLSQVQEDRLGPSRWRISSTGIYGKSVLGAIAASLSVLEVVGKVADEDLISTDSRWKSTLGAWQVKLERNALPRQQAGCTPVSIIIALEMVVKIEVWPRLSRAIIWLYLLMHWAVLRSDDCQGIDASRLSLTAVCLNGTLTKRKTTGPGRRTLEVPFFVSGDGVWSGTDGLEVGFQIWVSTDYQIKRARRADKTAW